MNSFWKWTTAAFSACAPQIETEDPLNSERYEIIHSVGGENYSRQITHGTGMEHEVIARICLNNIYSVQASHSHDGLDYAKILSDLFLERLECYLNEESRKTSTPLNKDWLLVKEKRESIRVYRSTKKGKECFATIDSFPKKYFSDLDAAVLKTLRDMPDLEHPNVMGSDVKLLASAGRPAHGSLALRPQRKGPGDSPDP